VAAAAVVAVAATAVDAATVVVREKERRASRRVARQPESGWQAVALTEAEVVAQAQVQGPE